jgi:hypothetical protein
MARLDSTIGVLRLPWYAVDMNTFFLRKRPFK